MSSKITHVMKRSGAVVPFNKDRITNAIYRAAVAVGGRDRSIAERLSDQVVAILEQTFPPGRIPTVEEIQDIVEKVLIENGHARTAKAYILYRAERARQRALEAAGLERDPNNIPYRKLWEALVWALDHELHSLALLNERIQRGEFAEIVRECEAFYEAELDFAIQHILPRKDQIRMVIIAGPSSSGKTTTTIKLRERLSKEGLNLLPFHVDNYFFDWNLHPKDEFGDLDFETPQALDLALVNEHLRRLLAGEEIRMPYYDFRTGKRYDAVTPLRLEAGQILLIDSLHGLYPDMTQGIPQDQMVRLYVEALLQMKGPNGQFIRWSDLRLMRRMVRDAAFRSYNPTQTLEHWHYVRNSELRNIIPHIHRADCIINSALAYEVAVMRPRLIDFCPEWLSRYRDDPLKQDAALRAERICRLLHAVPPAVDESVIPPTSIIREFIGGSAYTY